MKAFISYSHQDEKYLKRLETHLAQIKREGLLESWTDNEINAGENLSEKISEELSGSDLFIALLSPDYIASNYCYEKEFQTALKMLSNNEIIIVPVICEPCDWTNTPFKELLAVPKDGKPISEWANENTAYVSIVGGLRKLLKGADMTSDLDQSLGKPTILSKNYKVQKDFDSIQKLEFIEKSFKETVSFLKTYISELKGLENISVRILKDEENKLKFILVNRNMVMREATLLLEYNKELDPSSQNMMRYMGGQKDFSLNVAINNNSYDFDLSYNEYELFWQKAGANRRLDDTIYNPELIATVVINDVMKAVGISTDE